MKNIKLSNRLLAVAKLISFGTGVVDVGTDHGYIPIFLVQNGYTGFIYASDINIKPLENAIASAKEYGVLDNIKFFLSDGLDFTSGDGISSVIIAGMGGETMIDIIEKAPWILLNAVQLILQPQTKIPELLSFLDKNHFCINDALLVKDAERIYPVFSAIRESTRLDILNAEIYAYELLLKNKDPLLYEYIEGLMDKYKKEIHGIKMAKLSDIQLDQLAHLEPIVKAFENILEETEKW